MILFFLACFMAWFLFRDWDFCSISLINVLIWSRFTGTNRLSYLSLNQDDVGSIPTAPILVRRSLQLAHLGSTFRRLSWTRNKKSCLAF